MVTPATDLASILEGDVVEVARRLIGATLQTRIDGYQTAIVVTEVEAYGGLEDAASHAVRGRTQANASMFGEPGTLYVYRSYGVHWCANVVVGPRDEPAAVLLRGGEPSVGIPIMERRRKRTNNLTDGPGKLCQALGITGEHDGVLLGGPIELIPGTPLGPVVATPRIGITKATDLPWRFAALR